MAMEDKALSVKLGRLIQEFNLEVLCAAPDYENIPIRTIDVNRPGLPLAGFFEHFDTQRLLVMGLTETSYVNQLTPEERLASFERLLSYPVPALIVTRGLEVSEECYQTAKKYGRTVLRTPQETAVFMSSMISSLYRQLAPSITRSGVMMEVYGVGVLIQGESGVGKSEVAIGLIKRGHRLVADDAVEIRETTPGVLEATAPPLIRRYMELRGIGVIDVARLFGIGAIKISMQIDIVVKLEPWNDQTNYDRFGLDYHYTEIMGVKLPLVTIPVKPGRDLASIVEVAAMNNRDRFMGHNAAQELTQRMDEHFEQLLKQQQEEE